MTKRALEIRRVLRLERQLHAVIGISNPRVRTQHQLRKIAHAVVQMLRDHAFVRAEVNRAHEIRVGRKAAAERPQLGLEQLRNSGQHIHVFDLHGRKADITSLVEDRALGPLGHFEAGLERAIAKVLTDYPLEVRVDHEAALERARHAFHREIVMRRADPARSDDKIEIARAVSDFACDEIKLVGDSRDTGQGYANLAQLASCEVRVRVLNLAGKDFVTHNHQRATAFSHSTASSLRDPPQPALSQAAATSGNGVQAEYLGRAGVGGSPLDELFEPPFEPRFDLPHPLAADSEARADLLQRLGILGQQPRLEYLELLATERRRKLLDLVMGKIAPFA